MIWYILIALGGVLVGIFLCAFVAGLYIASKITSVTFPKRH